MQYETGKWYAWDGKQEKPECLDGAEVWVTAFDNSGWDRQKRTAIKIDPEEKGDFWMHSPCANRNVVAFYVVSYPEKPKEMTVAEIEKELGYSVKIVK